MIKQKGIKLRYVISILVILIILLTTFVNWYSTNVLFKDTLTEKYLTKNYEYAKKISLDTSVLIEDMSISIENLATAIGEGNFTQQHLDHWLMANSTYFNSLLETDSNGILLRITPTDVKNVVVGNKLEDDILMKLLGDQKPSVSKPYVTQSGRHIIFVSHPIFDKNDHYQGLVGGTVYLKYNNSLSRLLEKHDLLDNSTNYVVDREGKIIFHNNPEQVDKKITDTQLLEKIKNGESGATYINNEFLTGYAYMANTGWTVISQTPVSIMEQPLEKLFMDMMQHSLPLLIVLLIITVLTANRISTPLTKLAAFSRESILNGKVHETNQKIKIRSSITEVRQLYHDIQDHLQILTELNQKDGLTGLANRRTFDSQIKEWVDTHTPFALIMLDIDRFKIVNDTYGHLVGDDVLKYLARQLEESCQKDDRCFRYGGEEFMLLLKEKDTEEAFEIAENLRKTMERTLSPTGHPITISLGITTFKIEEEHPKPIIERADTALYHSKQTGRNKTTIFEQVTILS